MQWSDGVSPELPPQRSIEDLRNHYDRHTKYCSACQKVRLMTCLEGFEVPACMCAVELLLVSYPCDIF